MFLQWLFSILGVICIFHSSLSAQVKESDSLLHILEELNPGPKDLIVLDVDWTVLCAEEPALSYHAIVQHRHLLQTLPGWKNKEARFICFDLIARRYNTKLIEQQIVEKITQLQEKGVSIIFLTAMGVHDYGTGFLGPEIRFAQLKNVGIVPSVLTGLSEEFALTDMQEAFGYYPVHYKGVVVSNPEGKKNGKGEVLASLINYSSFVPKRVIFVDDRKENIDSVEQSLQKIGITHEGWVYTGAKKLEKIEVNEEDFLSIWTEITDDALMYKNYFFTPGL